MSEPRLPDLARSFERHLRAENKSDRTVETDLEAVSLLQAYLARQGVDLAEADRAQIEALRRLLAACAGKDLKARRDTAMIMLLLDSGARRAELVGLKVEDLNFEHDVARVIGGPKGAGAAIRQQDGRALDRYLRIRSRHAHAASSWLWLGQKGPLIATGLAQMLWRRGRQAGIEGLHAHQLRHTFAHAWRLSPLDRL
jgi:integrase